MAGTLELERLIVRLVGDSSAYVKMLEDSQKRTTATTQRIAADFQRMSLAIAAPIIALAGVSAKTYADFETNIVRTGTLIKDVTIPEMQALEETAKKMGMTTAFSAVQAAEAMIIFARAGKKPQEIMDAMVPTLNLASAELITISQSAEAVSDVMAGMQLPAEQLSAAIDTLGVASAASRTSVLELSQGIRYAGPAAHALNVGLEDITASLEVLAEAGIPGAQAGRGLRTILARLASPTKEAQQWFNKLNIELFDAKGQFIGMEKTIAELKRGMDLLTQEEQIQFSTDVAGIFQLSTLQNLVEIGTKKFKGFRDQLNNTKGTLQEMADKQLNTLAGSMKLLRSNVEGLAIELGQMLAPSIRFVASQLGDALKWFNSLDKTTKEIIVGTALLVAGFLAVGAAIATFAFVGGPLGIVVGIIAGIGTALAVVEQHTGAVSKLWAEAQKSGTRAWGAVVKLIKQVWAELLSLREVIGATLQEAWSEVLQFVRDVEPTFRELWADISKDAIDAWEWIGPIRQELFDLAASLVKVFGKSFVITLKATFEFAKGVIQIFKEVYGYIRSGVHAASRTWEILSDSVLKVMYGAEFAVSRFGKLFNLVIAGARLSLIGMFNDFKHFFGVGLPSLGKFFMDYWIALFSAIGEYSGRVLTNIVSTVIATVKAIPELVAKGLTPKEIATVLNMAFKNIADVGFEFKMPKLEYKGREKTEAENALFKKIQEDLKGLDDDLDKFLEDKMNRHKGAIKFKVPLVGPTIEEADGFLPEPKLNQEALDVGKEMGKKMGQGMNGELDKFKPSPRFDAILADTVESAIRLAEHNARLFGQNDPSKFKAPVLPFDVPIPGGPKGMPSPFPRGEMPRPFMPFPQGGRPQQAPLGGEDPLRPLGFSNAPAKSIQSEQVLALLEDIRDELVAGNKAGNRPRVGGGLA